MRLELIKAVARSLLRTANRRLSQYRKSGIKNPDIEDILETVSERPYFNKEKGRLKMGGLDRDELEELVQVSKDLRSAETVKQYEKTVKEVYRQSGLPENTDVNLFYRAMKRFEAAHGTYYKEWTNTILEDGNIESKGGTLENWFKDILKEQSGYEYSPEEVASKTSEDGWQAF